jgi:hypothetical protein
LNFPGAEIPAAGAAPDPRRPYWRRHARRERRLVVVIRRISENA